MGRPTRRDVLSVLTAGVAGTLAGCSDGETRTDPAAAPTGPGPSSTDPTSTPAERAPDSPTGSPSLAVDPGDLRGVVRPDADPDAVPEPLDCDRRSFERHFLGFEDAGLEWGTARVGGEPAFGLRADAPTVARGEDLRVRLTNLRAEPRGTGNRHKYNLQAYTTAGWQEVRGWADGTARPYTDELVRHEPGAGFEWTLTFTEAGVLDGHVHEGALVVCPGLPAARYRFVFWGSLGGAVAVAFDLVE